jgi:hypothetical protein
VLKNNGSRVQIWTGYLFRDAAEGYQELKQVRAESLALSLELPFHHY